ncbi:glycosyltransferase family 2 protein [Leuconostoc citreum]
MQNPVVSIIVPVYNVENFIKPFIKSLQNQSFQNFEVLMVDDGSDDNSLKILNDISFFDKRFKIISQTNQGAGAARNNGIKNSCGELLLFLDPDDTVSSNLLKDNVEILQSSEANMIVFGYDVIMNQKKIREVYFEKQIGTDITDARTFTNYYEAGVFDTLWNKIIKANIVKNNNIESPNWIIAQDRGLLLEIVKYKPQIIFNHNHQVYYHYNFKRAGSTIARFNSSATLSIARTINIIIQILKDWGQEAPEKLIYLMVVNGLYFDAGIYNSSRLTFFSSLSFIKEVNKITELKMIDRVSIKKWHKNLDNKQMIKLLVTKLRLGFLISFYLRFSHEKY